MTISLPDVLAAAPDEASIKAAKKLLKPAIWQGHGVSKQVRVMWGVCQGSGAKPYNMAVDLNDLGAKCSCPSRKFPCKHSIALMWQYVESPTIFAESSPPQWVVEWLSRRKSRKAGFGAASSTGDAQQITANANKLDDSDQQALGSAQSVEQNLAATSAKHDGTEQSILQNSAATTVTDDGTEQSIQQNSAATTVTEDGTAQSIQQEQAATLAKQEEAAKKRAALAKEKRDATLAAGVTDLMSWIDDYLRSGIGPLLREHEPFKQYAPRLVDAKATALANRFREIQRNISTYPPALGPQLLVRELGQLVLLAQAFLVNHDDPDARSAVAMHPRRDLVTQDEQALRVAGTWLTIGVYESKVSAGLGSTFTWLIPIDTTIVSPGKTAFAQTVPPFVSLVEYGTKQTDNALNLLYQNIGTILRGEITFYPSRVPQQGFISQLGGQVERQPDNHAVSTVLNTITNDPQRPSLAQTFATTAQHIPWEQEVPYLLGPGRIMVDKQGSYWWQSKEADGRTIPLHQPPSEMVQASDLAFAFVLWDGLFATVISAFVSPWGLIY